jgi:MFS family permease
MDAIGRKPGLCLSFFLGGLSLLLFSAVTSDLVLYIAGAASGIFLVSIPAALHVVAGEIYPTRIRSSGLGSAYAIGRIGSVVGPIIGGIVQMAGLSFGHFFLVFSVPSFVCVVLVAFYPVGVKREGLEEVTAKLLK